MPKTSRRASASVATVARKDRGFSVPRKVRDAVVSAPSSDSYRYFRRDGTEQDKHAPGLYMVGPTRFRGATCRKCEARIETGDLIITKRGAGVAHLACLDLTPKRLSAETSPASPPVAKAKAVAKREASDNKRADNQAVGTTSTRARHARPKVTASLGADAVIADKLAEVACMIYDPTPIAIVPESPEVEAEAVKRDLASPNLGGRPRKHHAIFEGELTLKTLPAILEKLGEFSGDLVTVTVTVK